MTKDARAGARFAPRVATWQVPRPRLVERIESGRVDGIVILRGPAGAGKTLAAAEWAAQSTEPTTWVTVHDDIASRFALWERVATTVGGGGAEQARASLDARSEPHVRLALSALFGDDAHTVVLDGLHLVTDERVHEDIAWLARSTRCSFVITTRTTLPLESGVLAANTGPTLIPTPELALTRDESASVLGSASDLDPEDMDTAFTALQGWPLATRLLALELGRGESRSIDAALTAVSTTLAADHPTLPEALSDPSALEFATRISIADWVTPELADALAGVPAETEALLTAFESAGLGSWSDGPDGSVFTLQPFVRRVLLHLLDSDGRRARSTRLAYATWADATGRPVIAGRQAAHLRDWVLLAGIVRRHFTRIMVVHRSEWARILADVPFDRLQRHPELGAVLIQLLNADSGSTDRMRAIATVMLSSVAPVRDSGSVSDQLWRNCSILAAERISGRYAAASRTAERIVGLVAALSPEAHADNAGILPILYVHIATTRLYAGNDSGAVAALEEALRLENATQWSHLHARSLLALVTALRGDMTRADAHLRALETDISIAGWRGTYSAAGYHLARALQHLEAFDPEAARAEVGQLERHFDTIEHWPLIVAVRGLIALEDGTASAAAWSLPGTMRARARRAPTSATARDLVNGIHAELHTAAGETPLARDVLAHSDDRDSPDVLLAAARAAVAESDDARAIMLASRLIGARDVSPRILSGALLTTAVAHERAGATAQAQSAAARAADILLSHGLALPVALTPRDPLRAAAREVTGAAGVRLRAVIDSAPELTSAPRAPLRLTAREFAVLDQLVTTASIRTIAENLFVSPNTVKAQVRSLYRKLEVTNREDAISAAATSGLLGRD